MGLLDNLLKGTGDPEKDRALSQGILQAGLSLLASKGNFGSALGQAGMAGVQGYQGAQDRQFQNTQRQMQMEQQKRQAEEWKRQQAMQALPQQFLKPSVLPPTMDNRDVGQPGEQAIPARQFDFQGYADALAQYDPAAAMQMRASLQKDETPIKASPGDVFFDKKFNKLAEVKKPEEQPNDVREYLYAKQQQGYKGTFEQWRLAERRAGASNTSVSYGAPVAGVDKATGEPVFFRPPKGSGPPEIVPGVRPPPKDPKDPTEFQDKAGLYSKSMAQATETLAKIEAKGGARVPFEEAVAPERMRNVIRSPRRQAYVQAQRQWIDSINRVRSGANLPEIEYERAVKTFFPEYGDDRKEIIEQKAAARKQEETAMRAAAGRALQSGQQAPATPGAVLRFDAQGNPVN